MTGTGGVQSINDVVEDTLRFFDHLTMSVAEVQEGITSKGPIWAKSKNRAKNCGKHNGAKLNKKRLKRRNGR